MTQQTINLGTADKGNGDVLRTAFGKVNANFAELYNQIATSVVVGATAPTGPEEGALWWNSESGRMYVYYGTAWVDASPVDGAGIASTNELVNGGNTVSLGSDGKLTLPNGVKITPIAFAGIDLEVGTKIWNFGTDGVLTFPGGTLADLGGAEFGTGFSLTTDGDQAIIGASNLISLETSGGYGQLHLTQDTETDKGRVEIFFQNGPGVLWIFDEADSSLTFPDTTKQTTAWTGITGFGEGFSLTDADKIVTNKLYSTNLTQPTQHYRLELDTNGVVRLPDGSIINGSTIRGVAGTGELNYTGITIGPNSNDAEKTWVWVDHANAYITTNNAANTWTFGNNGSTTFPDNTVLTPNTPLTIQTKLPAAYGPFNTAYFESGNGSVNGVNMSGYAGYFYITTVNINNDGTYSGSGYPTAIQNGTNPTYTISGVDLGGTSPANDCLLTVTTVDDIITNVVVSGTPLLPKWTFGTDGTLTLPNSGTITSDNVTVRGQTSAAIKVTNAINPLATRDWVFDGSGKLTIPGGLYIAGSSINNKFDDGAGNIQEGKITTSTTFVELLSSNNVTGADNTQLSTIVTSPTAVIITNTQEGPLSTGVAGQVNISASGITISQSQGNGATQSDWTFGNDGNLTVPADSSILTNETALKIATHPTETYTFDQAYWASVDGDITRVVTPTGNAQYFACTVTANQDGTYTVGSINPGNSFVPGNWFKVPGDELGGATPANDIQITVATVAGAGEILTVNPTGTAVSKQWQFGEDGGLTLPDASVITSYKPVTVIAATTTAQTITDNASAAFIQFVDTVDTASSYSSGTFTAPYTGYYQINMSIYFSTVAELNPGSFLLIDTNLDNTKQVTIFNGTWGGKDLHYSTVIPATAGDAIRIAIRQVSGADIDIASGSRLTIHRVSIS